MLNIFAENCLGTSTRLVVPAIEGFALQWLVSSASRDGQSVPHVHRHTGRPGTCWQ